MQTGTKEDVEKYSKRTVRVTREHNAECRRLLQLLGVPIIDAPSEAEAQCASLCSQGLVYGIATEDMDALTFATPRLIRHLMSPAAANKPVTEFEYDQVRAGVVESMGEEGGCGGERRRWKVDIRKGSCSQAPGPCT